MGRKKVTMELVGSRSIRAVTFKKRKSSLFKKASELSTLCGIEVCLALSKGPDDPAPEVWYSLEVMTQMGLQANGQSNGKLDKKLARQVAEMQLQLQHLEEENLDLQAILDGRLKEVQDKIDSISISSSAALGMVHPTLIGPEAGKCVVSATEQDIAGYSDPLGVA